MAPNEVWDTSASALGQPLPARLQALVDADPARGHTYVDPDTDTSRFVSYAELADAVARRASALLALGLVPTERVALVLPRTEDFVLTFLGAMHAGLVPVPMSPPLSVGRLEGFLQTAAHIVQRAGAVALVCDAQVRAIAGTLLRRPLRMLVDVAALRSDLPAAPLAPLRAQDPAFVQFTSGSTSAPKGVLLTHQNLTANAHSIMHEGLRAGPDDIGCSWLPFYHDMGLIGFVLAPIVTATPVVYLPPMAFLKRPARWLQEIARHRATISFAPNFAYGLCAARIRPHEVEGLDLSCWRVAGCGAEPIQRQTLDTFTARFTPQDFSATAFVPCFGMAEATLAVTFHPVGEALRTARIDLQALAAQRVAQTPTDAAAPALEVVGCGIPFAGHAVEIWDTADKPVSADRVGQIVVRGPSVMAGYDGAPEDNRSAVVGGWLRTGDEGFLRDGHLYVCGRQKDLIIVSGRNYHPTDIEWACRGLDGLRTGNVVAFGLGGFDQGPERVVVAAELRGQAVDAAAVLAAVRAAVLQAVGLRVDEVVLLAPGALPKTSSGKLQRQQTKQRYLLGTLRDAPPVAGRLTLLQHVAASRLGFARHRVRNALSDLLSARAQ